MTDRERIQDVRERLSGGCPEEDFEPKVTSWELLDVLDVLASLDERLGKLETGAKDE